MEKLYKEERSDVPTLPKTQTPLHWTESLNDCLYYYFWSEIVPYVKLFETKYN